MQSTTHEGRKKELMVVVNIGMKINLNYHHSFLDGGLVLGVDVVRDLGLISS
jgi:hypothetical protein